MPDYAQMALDSALGPPVQNAADLAWQGFAQQFPAVAAHREQSEQLPQWLASRAEFDANNSVMDRQFNEGASVGRNWPAVAEELARRFPALNPEAYRGAYEAAHNAAFRQGHVDYLQQTRYASAPWSEYRNWVLGALPFASTLVGVRGEQPHDFRAAQDRIGQGQGTEADYDLTARFRAEQQRQHQLGETFPGLALQVAHSALPFVTEMLLTGGTAATARQALERRLAATLGEEGAARVATRVAGYAAQQSVQAAITPSLGLAQAQAAAERNGGEWYSPGNLAQGQAAGTLQAGIFHTVGYPGGLPGQALGRHVVAPIAGAIASDIALHRLGLAPTYGSAANLGSAEGLRHLAAEALVFGLIGAGTHTAGRLDERADARRARDARQGLRPIREPLPPLPANLGEFGPSLERPRPEGFQPAQPAGAPNVTPEPAAPRTSSPITPQEAPVGAGAPNVPTEPVVPRRPTAFEATLLAMQRGERPPEPPRPPAQNLGTRPVEPPGGPPAAPAPPEGPGPSEAPPVAPGVAPGGPPPTGQPSGVNARIEALRQRQARQGTVATPEPRPLPELPRVEQRPAAEQLRQQLEAAGLTAQERHVLVEARQGRTYDAIAQDEVMRKPDGGVYSRARVQQMERAARAKLVEATGVQLPSGPTSGPQVERPTGAEVPFTELHGGPEAAPVRGARQIRDLTRIDADISGVADQWIREREAGTLTPEKEAQYTAEVQRLGEERARREHSQEISDAEQEGRSEGLSQDAVQRQVAETLRQSLSDGLSHGSADSGGEAAAGEPAGTPAAPEAVPGATVERLRAAAGRGNHFEVREIAQGLREFFSDQAVDRALAQAGYRKGPKKVNLETFTPEHFPGWERADLQAVAGHVQDVGAGRRVPYLERSRLDEKYGQSNVRRVIDLLRGQLGLSPEETSRTRGIQRQAAGGSRKEGLREQLKAEMEGKAPEERDWEPHPEMPFETMGDAYEPPGVTGHETDFDPVEIERQEAQVQQAMTGQPRMIGGGQASGPGIVLHPKVQEALHRVGDFFAKLAGVTAPATQRHSEAAADAIARHGSAKIWAEHAAPYYTEMMLGKDAPEAKRLLWGAVFVEKFRLRYAKAQFQIEADRVRRQAQGARTPGERQGLLDQAQEWEDKAAAVQTLVGPDPGARLRRGGIELTEELYRRTLNSPEFQAMLQKWHDQFVPVQEGFYRQAEGMDVDDPIHSRTQTPGYAVNVIPLKAEEMANTPGAMRAQGGRGNLKAVKQQKLVFTREFTGTADAYDVDLGHMIENTLFTSAHVATKAELYRVLNREGVATWGRENAFGTRVGGEETTRIPGVSPPRGTQEAERGETALWVRNSFEPEVRQVLGPDRPYGKLPGTDLLTTINLWSAAEAMAHTRNLLTVLFKPGVSILDLAKNMKAVYRGDSEAQRRVMDLAQIGAARGKRMEAAPDAGILRRIAESPLNPLYWTSKFLDFVDRSVRLTMNDAFDRLAARGAANTESNRRDFINQLGNYNKRTQSRLVAFLRDTGLSPFATAAGNFTMQGIRALTGNPGVRTNTPEAQVRLRAEYIGRMGALIAAGAVWNFLRWGRLDGDDNTPLGAVKLGVGRDGRTAYFDLAGLTGITRGARTVGLLALLEGVRQGRSRGAIIDRAGHDMIGSALHAAEGPAVQFGHTVATGENSLGIRVAERNGESQLLNNLRAALWNANPLVATLSASDQPQRVHPEPVPLEQRAASLLSPLGLRFRGDQAVSVLAERLREVEGARQAFRSTPAWRSGQAFPREQEYHTLQRAQEQLTTLNQELQGLVRTRRGLAPGREANPQRQEEIRRRQGQIAQQALGR